MVSCSLNVSPALPCPGLPCPALLWPSVTLRAFPVASKLLRAGVPYSCVFHMCVHMLGFFHASTTLQTPSLLREQKEEVLCQLLLMHRIL